MDVINDILNGNEERINDLFSTEDIKYNVYEYRNKIIENIVNLINDYKNTNTKSSIEEAKCILEKIKQIKKQNEKSKNPYIELINYLELRKDDLELEKLKAFLGNEWIEKMTNFSDYQENNRKLITNQYVKKLMK